jgi:hypothetical protein
LSVQKLRLSNAQSNLTEAMSDEVCARLQQQEGGGDGAAGTTSPVPSPSAVPTACEDVTAQEPIDEYDHTDGRDGGGRGDDHVESSKVKYEMKSKEADDRGECIICLDNDGPPFPLQSGCACRGPSGQAHLACRIEAAVHLQDSTGSASWWECGTCKQNFTGSMELGLTRAWHCRTEALPDDSDEKLAAAAALASALSDHGDYQDAAQIEREVLATRKRIGGDESLDTLTVSVTVFLNFMSVLPFNSPS